MREILFRGKTYKEGLWIEGSLIVDEKGSYYIGQYIESRGDCSYYCTNRRNGKTINRFIGIGFAMVDKDTVCEYTQLKDKNGKRIFEGDILKGEQYPFCDNDGDYNYFAEVIWFDNSPAFGIYTFKNPKSNVRGTSTGNTAYIEDFTSEDWEVIGNIHDNPELMEAINK